MARKGDRYDVTELEEAQFEPGSRDRVLKNLQGIKSKKGMDELEQLLQVSALEWALSFYGPRHRFNAADICLIHKTWLEIVYPWAGQYRRVNIAKGKMSFAAAQHIPKLMRELEGGPLRDFTPCRPEMVDDPTAVALAVVHVELILIHPFRDGNGRVARILANLMASQANLPLLDFSGLAGKKRESYFAAIRAGLAGNYGPMIKIFIDVIDRTRRTSLG